MKKITTQSKPIHNGKVLGTKLTKDLPPFTTKNSRNPKRQNDDDGSNGRQGGAKRQNRGRALDQPYVSNALAEKGYHVQLEEEIEGWTPRHPVCRLSVNEILIDIEELIR